MKKALFVSVLAFAVYFVACKKSDDNQKKGTADLVIGKWSFVRDSVAEFKKGGKFIFGYIEPHAASDYLEFTADGKTLLYAKLGNDTDVYHVVNDTTIVFWRDSSKVLSLTDSLFKAYFRYIHSDSSFTDEFLDFKK